MDSPSLLTGCLVNVHLCPTPKKGFMIQIWSFWHPAHPPLQQSGHLIWAPHSWPAFMAVCSVLWSRDCNWWYFFWKLTFFLGKKMSHSEQGFNLWPGWLRHSVKDCCKKGCKIGTVPWWPAMTYGWNCGISYSSKLMTTCNASKRERGEHLLEERKHPCGGRTSKESKVLMALNGHCGRCLMDQ